MLYELHGAMARFNQARAAARVSGSDWLPGIDLDATGRRERYSQNQVPNFDLTHASKLSVPLDLSYEIDLWGRVRRSFEGARAGAQASAADFHHALLAVQADVARNYFSLRTLDRQRGVLLSSLGLRREARDVLQARVDAGTAPELDRARAETEVGAAEADLARLERNRSSLENALAILTGTLAPQFSVAALENPGSAVPRIPPGLPSALLERRPDVAMAERQLAAANARIGVAKAAFFPVLRLTGSAGFTSADVDSLFNWESRIWSLGPSLSLPIFAGGRNKATLAGARAAFAEAGATYRQRVLVAFAEVQETLTALRFLEEEAAAVARTRQAATRTYEYAKARHEGGVLSYFEVIESQRTLLVAELDSATVLGQRQTTTVQLIKALGGGWNGGEPLANDR